MAKEKIINKNRRKITFASIFGGKILLESKKRMDFVIFITILIIVYINYTYKMQNLILEIGVLGKDIENKRAEKVTISSKLMNYIVQSNIIKQIDEKNLNLIESNESPYILKNDK